MRLAFPAAVLLAIALLSGCGKSSEQTTTDRSGGERAPAREVRAAWERSPSCKRPPGASRWGCSVGSYRCQAVVVGRGWSVSCSRPGKSTAFVIRRD